MPVVSKSFVEVWVGASTFRSYGAFVETMVETYFVGW